MREVDQNTKFFHMKSSAEKKKNKISRIEDGDCNWHIRDEEIYKATMSYFKISLRLQTYLWWKRQQQMLKVGFQEK